MLEWLREADFLDFLPQIVHILGIGFFVDLSLEKGYNFI
jgi:hypothetical protein